MANLWGAVKNVITQSPFQVARNIVQNQQKLAASGQTGHTGSWGTPERGWTEAIKSAIVRPAYAAAPAPVPNPYNQPVAQPTTTFGDLNRQYSATGTTGGGGGGGGTTTLESGTPQYDFSSMAPEEIPQEVLDSLYSGAYAQLSAQEEALRGQQPITEASLKQAGEEQKLPYEERRTKGREQLTGEETETRKQEMNAYQLARQIFNELNQYNLARFGTGTSAGQAAMELLGRSTQSSMGQAQQAAGENVAKIKKAWGDLDEFVDRSKADIDKQVSLKVQESQQWLKDRLNEINASRAGLESDKAARRYQALQARTDFINNIKSQQYAYNLQLDQWRQTQKNAMVSQAGGYNIAPTTAENLIGVQQRTRTEAPVESRTGTRPMIIGGQGVGVYNPSSGSYAQSMRYKKLPTGEVQDMITGQVLPGTQFQQGEF